MKKFPLSRPYIGKEEERVVLSVLRSGVLSLGPKQVEFGKKFAQKNGNKYACAVSSGTAGLHLALIAAGIGPGDEVITTPFSFVASSNAILYVGAKPVFVDIDPITYNIDPQKIERAITQKTKAILVVHIFGQAADMDPILQIARKYKIKVIEDACESLGATYHGIKTGNFGESAVFAFYPNKQITTGEGGMIVTDNKKTYDLCSSLRNQGRSSDMHWLDHKLLGYNYRMDEMSAALGLVQLQRLDALINERRKMATLYEQYLLPHRDLFYIPRIAERNTHTWFVFCLRIKNKKVSRDKIMRVLARNGISTKPYLPSIHLLSFYKRKYGYKKGDFPVSEGVSNHSLAVPFYPGLKENDIKHIVSKLVETTRKT